MTDYFGYKFFKRKAKAEEYAREMQGEVFDSNSDEYAFATKGEEGFKEFFKYVVVFANPQGYFVVEWLDEDTYNMEHYNYKDDALARARGMWELMSDKAKDECIALEVVKAITNDSQTFFLDDVLEIVEVVKAGKHIDYILKTTHYEEDYTRERGKYLILND